MSNWKIVATHAGAKQQLAEIFADEAVKAQVKQVLAEMANMADPRLHPAVCPIACTHGGAWRTKVPPVRLAFRLYYIDGVTPVEIWLGESVPQDAEKFIDIFGAFLRSDTTYQQIKQIWKALE
jgi:hypothetical protein